MSLFKKKRPKEAELSPKKKEADELTELMQYVIPTLKFHGEGVDIVEIAKKLTNAGDKMLDNQDGIPRETYEKLKSTQEQVAKLIEGIKKSVEETEEENSIEKNEDDQATNKSNEEDGWVKVQRKGKRIEKKPYNLTNQTPKRKRNSEELQVNKKVDARSSASKKEQMRSQSQSYADKARPLVKKTPFFKRFPGGLQVHRKDSNKIGCTLNEWRALEGHLEAKMWERMATEDLKSPIASFMGYSKSGYGLIACTSEENKLWFKAILENEDFRGWGSEEKTEREKELLEQKNRWTFLVRPAPDKKVDSKIILAGLKRINKLQGNCTIEEEFTLTEKDNVRVISVKADEELHKELKEKKHINVGYGKVNFTNRMARRPNDLVEGEKQVEIVTEAHEESEMDSSWESNPDVSERLATVRTLAAAINLLSNANKSKLT